MIGSLLWDIETKGRAEWRDSRLETRERAPVRVPIYYGRKSRSRGDTYTMAFGPSEPAGQAVLVPCSAKICKIDSLIAEAHALWKAEAPKAKPTAISSEWECVGALFGRGQAHAKLSADWIAHFQNVKAQCVSVINADGLLDIRWPNTLDDKPADFDIVLATATKPGVTKPSAQDVADAWADQCGNEDYFFNNVLHGIRTPDDGIIWRRIEEKVPCWLEKKKREYQGAIEILRSEFASHTQS
ncbi:MAG: hypothetical protein ACKVP5_17920 [Aestuariivirga sp.]